MSDTPTLKALVVEDSPEVAELIAFILEAEGYTPEICEDGKAAFRLATTEKYNLMVVDIYLPNWNGVEMLNSLAMVQEAVPVIVCTGGNAGSIRAELENPNVVDVLQKPFEVHHFKAVLNGLKSQPQ